jgi:DUF971 family protein
MQQPVLTKITKPTPYLIRLDWSDGVSTTITLRAFRDECPCASCKGETIMGTTYGGGGFQILKPGMYDLATVSPVGNYAIQADWNDGHNTGIYSWDILRTAAEKHALSSAEVEAMAAKTASQGS